MRYLIFKNILYRIVIFILSKIITHFWDWNKRIRYIYIYIYTHTHTHIYIYIYIYICIERERAVSKLSPFWIINFARALCLFQILSSMLQTCVIWVLSVRKAVPLSNLLLQKFGNSILYWFAFTDEALIGRFPSALVQRIQKGMSLMVIKKVR